MEQTQHQKWNILSLLPTVLVCVLIFYFCLQPGTESLQTSESMGEGFYYFFGGKVKLSQEQLGPYHCAHSDIIIQPDQRLLILCNRSRDEVLIGLIKVTTAFFKILKIIIKGLCE